MTPSAPLPGLFQTEKDISVAELRANTTMLAKLATLLKIPVMTTASEPNGPSGPSVCPNSRQGGAEPRSGRR